MTTLTSPWSTSPSLEIKPIASPSSSTAGGGSPAAAKFAAMPGLEAITVGAPGLEAIPVGAAGLEEIPVGAPGLEAIPVGAEKFAAVPGLEATPETPEIPEGPEMPRDFSGGETTAVVAPAAAEAPAGSGASRSAESAQHEGSAEAGRLWPGGREGEAKSTRSSRSTPTVSAPQCAHLG